MISDSNPSYPGETCLVNLEKCYLSYASGIMMNMSYLFGDDAIGY